MNINWTVRIANKAFWTSFIPAMLLLVTAIAKVFGFTLELSEFGNQLLEVVETLFLVLSIVGIVNDPTTATLSDSKQALTYITPKKNDEE